MPGQIFPDGEGTSIPEWALKSQPKVVGAIRCQGGAQRAQVAHSLLAAAIICYYQSLNCASWSSVRSTLVSATTLGEDEIL